MCECRVMCILSKFEGVQTVGRRPMRSVLASYQADTMNLNQHVRKVWAGKARGGIEPKTLAFDQPCYDR